MTANQAHTPTREQFKALIQQIAGAADMNFVTHEQALRDFDRMIAQVESAAEQRGAVKALRHVASMIKLGNEYYEMLVEDELNDRADQMEGDDEA